MGDELHTQFAIRAVGFADLFNLEVGAQRLTGPVTYRVELAAPDGPSTAGGKQGVQHIKLVPAGGDGAVVVAGWANAFEKRAEVRSFEYLAAAHAQRWKGARIPLDRRQYQELQKRMHGFFVEQGLEVTTLDAPPGASPAGSGRVALLGIVALLAALAAFFLWRHR